MKGPLSSAPLAPSPAAFLVAGLAGLAALLPGTPARAEHTAPAVEGAACSDYDAMRQPFFGDLHVHTGFSFDAWAQGVRSTPRDAYRFARGEPLGLPPYDREGQPARTIRIDRPLDFTAVTDHAELLGEIRICGTPGAQGYDADVCWGARNLPSFVGLTLFATRYLIFRDRWSFCGDGDQHCLARTRDVWADVRQAAAEANDTCHFTSLVGYEWTGTIGDGANLHRNVIFRSEHVPDAPVSWMDTPSASKLWERLRAECVDGMPGCDVFTIPHNSNLSAGLMFATASLETAADIDRPITRDEARERARMEPLVEIMQHKGDSECLLGGDTTDEACAFEKVPYNSFVGVGMPRPLPEAMRPLRADMVREALKKGLREEQRLGTNPLRYGIIASTDTHLGASGFVGEDSAVGHGGAGRAQSAAGPLRIPDEIENNPGGLAVVWAEENSREALFRAMLRRETYGTSGSRPIVRFFGGWRYPADLCGRRDLVAQGYAAGVPMGGDLPQRPRGARAPIFAISALRDPGTEEKPGTALQRIQVVKGWLERGETREKVYDVAGGESDASVDVATCQTSGSGADELCAVWTDPDFDPKQRAFYYVRVLENPTCRWSQQICVRAGVDCSNPQSVPPGLRACCMADVPPVVQERAWTSPIWYRP